MGGGWMGLGGQGGPGWRCGWGLRSGGMELRDGSLSEVGSSPCSSGGKRGKERQALRVGTPQWQSLKQ